MSKENQPFDSWETILSGLLRSLHCGKNEAIPARVLAKELKIDKRTLRTRISHLIIEHRLPIGAHDNPKTGGYFWIDSPEEEKFVYRIFRTRGKTSITRAARAEGLSELELAVDLVIEAVQNGKKVEGAGTALNKILDLFRKNPEQYASEIEDLRQGAVPLLVDKNRLREINQTARQLQQLTGGLL